MSALVEKLSATERARLRQQESIIEQGLPTCLAVAEALETIRDERLYRETHGRYEDYVRERWQITRGRAYQLIAYAAVNRDVSTIVGADLNEAQARVLAPLATENRQAVAGEAVRRSQETGEPITAALLEEIRHARFGDLSPEEQRDVLNTAEADAERDGLARDQRDGQQKALDQLGRRAKLCVRLCDQVGPEAEEAAAIAKQLVTAVERIELPARAG